MIQWLEVMLSIERSKLAPIIFSNFNFLNKVIKKGCNLQATCSAQLPQLDGGGQTVNNPNKVCPEPIHRALPGFLSLGHYSTCSFLGFGTLRIGKGPEDRPFRDLRSVPITEGPVLRSFSYLTQNWDFFTF